MKLQNINRRIISEHIFDIFNVLFLATLTLICLYPFYYVLIYSLSDPLRARGVTLLPAGFTLKNYLIILRLPGLAHAAFVSVARTVIGAGLTVFCSSLFAFVLTKDRLPIRKLMYRMTIATMYMSAGLIPWYLVRRLYHLDNTFWLYIVPTVISAYYVILLKTFIEQLPPSLEESAKIDGAGIMHIFFRIVLPLSTPIIATILVFSAVDQWNAYFDNYVLVSDKSLYTLQYILFTYLNRASAISTDINQLKMRGLAEATSPAAIKMTITMVVTLPVLFVYPIAQRYFVKGIMIGAIKG